MTTTVIVKNKESSHWEVLVTGGGSKASPVVKLLPGEEVEITIWDNSPPIQVIEGDPIQNG